MIRQLQLPSQAQVQVGGGFTGVPLSNSVQSLVEFEGAVACKVMGAYVNRPCNFKCV